MRVQTIRSLVRGGVGLTALLVAAPLIWTQQPNTDPDAPPPGVEVQARGPVHEAYAEPGGGRLQASPVVPKPAPDPIEEMPPDEKPDLPNVQWLPGYWHFDEEKNDYLWVSGFWRQPPPGRMWVPGRWDTVDGGTQWVPGFWAAAQEQQHEVTYLPQPPAPLEAQASIPAPSPDHVYVAGYWVYRDDRYVWHPGYWYLPRADWIWVPAHYCWTPAGYVFVEGYWDHCLRNRGIMYAPVYIDVAVARRPGWYYSPRLVIGCDAMCGALFVRPGCSVYYFGDYFEPGYRTTYVAYCDYHPYGCYDPIYCGARYEHRADPQWSVSISLSFGNMYSGVAPRPARTFVYNQTVVNNTVVNNTVINNNVVNNNVVNNNVVNNKVVNNSMVSTMKQVSASQGMAMKPVPVAERQEHMAAAKEMHAAAKQRSAMEAQAKAQGPPKAGQPARSVKMDVPKSQGAAVAKANAAAKTEAAKTGTTPPAHAAQPAAHTTTPTTQPANHMTGTTTQPKTNTPAATTTKPPLPSATTTKPGQPAAAGHTAPGAKPSQGKADQKTNGKSDAKTPPKTNDKDKDKDKDKKDSKN